MKQKIIDLIRRTATTLPQDVESAIRGLSDNGISADVLQDIQENITLARENSVPLCQDTGTLFFFVKIGKEYSLHEVRDAITEAAKEATTTVPLRPNTVDVLSGKSNGNYPVIYFEPADSGLEIDLLVKGGGSENVGRTYSLPNELGSRGFEGVAACVMDAVKQAGGKACPPMVVGVGIGSPKDSVAILAKKQLLRTIDDINPDAGLCDMEKRLLSMINRLNIGPGGLGGKNTALAVKIAAGSRHPASYFVEVCFSCWVLRRGKLRF